jgi:hypothetical protein
MPGGTRFTEFGVRGSVILGARRLPSGTASESSRVHRALAEVTIRSVTPTGASWHPASSTVTHDEAIAVELGMRLRVKARGGLLAAVLWRAAFFDSDGASLQPDVGGTRPRDAGALQALCCCCFSCR